MATGQKQGSLCRLYQNAAPPFSTLYGHPPYITPRKTEAAMYDGVLVIMGLAMFGAFLAYAVGCEKM